MNATGDRLREERRQLPEWQRRHYGLVADDPSVIEHLPGLVAHDEENNITGISLSDQVGMLQAALKELAIKTETIEAEIATLKQTGGTIQ